MSESFVTTLDVKGLACPMPVVKLAMAIKKIKVDEIIEVLATDPGALADIPAWANKTGNELLRHTKEDKIIKFYVKRRK
ncbi:MAG: sulfurtransferase TusA family protein [Candidatus Odinarchaeota archaeon]